MLIAYLPFPQVLSGVNKISTHSSFYSLLVLQGRLRFNHRFFYLYIVYLYVAFLI